MANSFESASRDADAPHLAPHDEYHALDDLIVLFGGDAEARAAVASRRDVVVKHLVACEECQLALAALLDAGSQTERLSADQRARLKQMYDRLALAMRGPHLDEAPALYTRYVRFWVEHGHRPQPTAEASPTSTSTSTPPSTTQEDAELAPVIRHLARHPECDEAVRRLYSAEMVKRIRAALEGASDPIEDEVFQQPLPLPLEPASAEAFAANLHWRELAREENAVAVRPRMRLTDYETYDIVVEGQALGELTLVVWGADRRHGNRQRTLKLLRPDYLDNADLRAAFVAAALEWCSVAPHGRQHAAPQLVGVPIFNDAPAVLVSYAPHTLAGVLEAAHRGSHPITAAQAFGWAQQIAAAVAALHRQKRPDGVTPYIHGDLKPSNILVGDEATAWLSDVGMHAVWASAHTTTSRRVHALARDHHEAEAAGQAMPPPEGVTEVEAELRFVAPHAASRGSVIGTPRYMAPERWLGNAAAGPASDVYSLGIVLYELFAGVEGGPFMPHPNSAAGWFSAHETGPSRGLASGEAEALEKGPLAQTLAEDGSGLSPEARESRTRMILGQLDGLIRRCLEADPVDRPTADEVYRRLAELAGRLGLEREPEPPAEAVALRVADPEHLHRLARSHGRAGHPDAQSDLLLDIVRRTPSPDLWISLGSALYDQGFEELALLAYDAAEALVPAQQPQPGPVPAPAPAPAPVLAFHRANAYFRLGRPAEALKAYDEALAHHHDQVPAMWGATAAQHQLAAASANLDERREHLRRADERARVARGHAQGTPHAKVIQLDERVRYDAAGPWDERRADHA